MEGILSLKRIAIVIVSALFSLNLTAQDGGGEYKLPEQHVECLSDAKREQVFTAITESRRVLRNNGILSRSETSIPLVHPLFIWPVAKNPVSPYANVWSISNHVDHNPSFPNQVQDYSCGSRTYDTSAGYNHKGVDIYTWPFSWYQFQNDQAWAVAAADGIIVYKEDGHFDMNCSMSGADWNAVYVEHADGSTAWYGHLKNNSLTTKPVGAAVIAGEYLGVVGSSGNSTGPHLHFEVYNAFNQLVDTYTGTCNNWNSSVDSWWIAQRPYQDAKINAVLTHSAPPVFNSCPGTETVNLSDSFENAAPVVGAVYIADQMAGTTGLIAIFDPNMNQIAGYQLTMSQFFSGSYWYWIFPASLFGPSGTYFLTFTYNGDTVTHQFFHGSLGVEEINKNSFEIYPNPVSNVLNIESQQQEIEGATIFDLVGNKVIEVQAGSTHADVSALADGMYVIVINSSQGITKMKFIKD
ncbi:MAG TPA: peptidoglycan DD-metalloendopeptidase family protein [Flavobacterium sp.]|jgi:hypothetical protein